MRFCVSVPVLSLAMTVALPRLSITFVRFTSTLRDAMRFAVMLRQLVTVAGRPSGTLATRTRMKPEMKVLMGGSLRPIPMPKNANAVMTPRIAMKLTKRCT
jgi:hypothetical protein